MQAWQRLKLTNTDTETDTAENVLACNEERMEELTLSRMSWLAMGREWKNKLTDAYHVPVVPRDCLRGSSEASARHTVPIQYSRISL